MLRQRFRRQKSGKVTSVLQPNTSPDLLLLIIIFFLILIPPLNGEIKIKKKSKNAFARTAATRWKTGAAYGRPGPRSDE